MKDKKCKICEKEYEDIQSGKKLILNRIWEFCDEISNQLEVDKSFWTSDENSSNIPIVPSAIIQGKNDLLSLLCDKLTEIEDNQETIHEHLQYCSCEENKED